MLASLERRQTISETSENTNIAVVMDGQAGASQGTCGKRRPVCHSRVVFATSVSASHSFVVLALKVVLSLQILRINTMPN